MSNDEQNNFNHFYILHIKNECFLLELEMALVTTFEMRFAMVCDYVLTLTLTLLY